MLGSIFEGRCCQNAMKLSNVNPFSLILRLLALPDITKIGSEEDRKLGLMQRIDFSALPLVLPSGAAAGYRPPYFSPLSSST
jgi:hypothetical protein